jgi:hypothetical protein
MPFGQSYAGLESLSVYRASVVQRMRTRQRAQYVGSMIICWCPTCSAVVASSPRNRANSLQSNGAITSLPVATAIPRAAWIASALLPAHEPYRHNGPSRAATILPWPSGFSPSYMKFGTGSWRNVIVARRTRKSSASSDAPAMVSLRELARWQIPSVQIVRQSNRAVVDGHGPGSCRRTLCLKWVKSCPLAALVASPLIPQHRTCGDCTGMSVSVQSATVHCRRPINQDFIDLFGQQGSVLVLCL